MNSINRVAIMKNKVQQYIFGTVLTVVISFAVTHTVVAQQAGYFNHQYLPPILFNPGATGFQGDHQLLAGYLERFFRIDNKR